MTDTRQTQKFVFQFLSPRGPKRAEKKFQLNRKKKNFGDCIIICLRYSGLIIIHGIGSSNVLPFRHIIDFKLMEETDTYFS